jgi:hypothetical protein
MEKNFPNISAKAKRNGATNCKSKRSKDYISATETNSIHSDNKMSVDST